jgi:hypothetical protein
MPHNLIESTQTFTWVTIVLLTSVVALLVWLQSTPRWRWRRRGAAARFRADTLEVVQTRKAPGAPGADRRSSGHPGRTAPHSEPSRAAGPAGSLQGAVGAAGSLRRVTEAGSFRGGLADLDEVDAALSHLSQLESFAARFATEMDERCERLESLVQLADARIRQLERLSPDRRPAPSERPVPGERPAPSERQAVDRLARDRVEPRERRPAARGDDAVFSRWSAPASRVTSAPAASVPYQAHCAPNIRAHNVQPTATGPHLGGPAAEAVPTRGETDELASAGAPRGAWLAGMDRSPAGAHFGPGGMHFAPVGAHASPGGTHVSPVGTDASTGGLDVSPVEAHGELSAAGAARGFRSGESPRERIVALIESGQSALSISETLGIPLGEVELVQRLSSLRS